jgi:hypothetical protein
MKKTIGALSALILIAISLLASPRPALAEEVTCVGTKGAVTVDNLRVPKNRSCTLNGTRVKGTIKVEEGATLTAYRVRVVGNIQAEGAKLVRVLTNSRVGGSIQIVQGGAANINTATVIGDILFDSNDLALRATRNQVGGDVQAFQNVGGVRIAYNVIDGNLQCKENTPRPTGLGNIVEGSKEDQCRNL